MKTKKQMILAAVASVLLIALDQLTKVAVILGLKGKNDFIIIKGVLEFHYLENTSAAFSLDPITLINKWFHPAFLQDSNTFLKTKMIFFVILTLVVLYFLVRLYIRIPVSKHFVPLNLVCIWIFSGAIGNCIDRVFRNYVVDFIYFKIINFPVFNVADIYVTCACALFIIVLLFVYKEADFDLIFPKKKNKKD